MIDRRHNGDSNCVIALHHNSNRRCYSNAMAMMLIDGRDGNGDGRRNGNGNGWCNGNSDRRRDRKAMATKLIDGTTATAMLMGGTVVTWWQQKVQWQHKGNNVDRLCVGNGNGCLNSNGNGRRNSEVVAMTVMDSATATAIAQQQRQWMAQQT